MTISKTKTINSRRLRPVDIELMHEFEKCYIIKEKLLSELRSAVTEGRADMLETARRYMEDGDVMVTATYMALKRVLPDFVAEGTISYADIICFGLSVNMWADDYKFADRPRRGSRFGSLIERWDFDIVVPATRKQIADEVVAALSGQELAVNLPLAPHDLYAHLTAV